MIFYLHYYSTFSFLPVCYYTTLHNPKDALQLCNFVSTFVKKYSR